MNFMELTRVAADEKRSEVFLRERGVLVTFKRCPRCGSPSPWETSRASLLCRSCGRETSVRHGSVLSRSKLPLSKFLLLLLKMFERNVPWQPCAREVALNRNRVMHYYIKFRKALSENPHRGSGASMGWTRATSPGGNKGNPGRGSEKKVPVFGILEHDGKVYANGSEG